MSEPDIDKYIAEIRARRQAEYGEAPPFRVIDGGKGDGPACPDLLINGKDLTETAKQLRDLFAKNGTFFFNGNTPVRVVSEEGWAPVAKEVSAEVVIVAAHELCRPVRSDGHGGLVPTTLPSKVAGLYLRGLEGDWELPPFNGICCAPILSKDGSFRAAAGYDKGTSRSPTSPQSRTHKPRC